ncbi:T9SS type A sorting domain-containing protein [Flavobacterium sp. HTF]|uniref:T9SS type A sorting domain-containing protein n=1 Tax=Flavobacterium sp. HTF TaxID=2170732 RepID=UPI0014027C23|nr:T9SS type A sorting domain-containing protein [Flavobacterium sp. HTF]
MKKTLLYLFILFTNLFYAQVSTVSVCNNESFNLITLKADFIGNLNPAQTTVTFFLSQADALNNTNEILNSTAYKGAVGITKIYGRIDNNGTITVNYADLTTFQSPIVTASNKPILCKGDTASLTINVSGGSGSYSYSLNGGSFTNNDYYPNLPAGTYNIQVLDNVSNCISSINYAIIEPASLQATVATANQNTFVTVTGGTQPYKYSLSGFNYQTNNYFSNLAPGNYNIVVSDSQGCVTAVATTILPALTSSVNITRALTCSMDYASINITAAGGQAPYTYSVDGKPYQVSNIYYDLYAGNHIVTVKDALNTTNSTPLYIEPYLPFYASSTITGASCYGANDGSVEITASGGRAPYTYSINHGPFVSGNIFNNLSRGYHTAVVMDAVGCFTDNFDIEILQPDPVLITPNIKNAGVNNNDGEIIITASKGNAPYSYSLSDNTGTVLTGPQSSNIFSGLPAGSYQVQVTDSKGCFSTRSYIDVDQSTLSANLTVASVTCNSPKGSITVTATGGVAPYEYSLNNGAYSSVNVFTDLTPKNYTVKVRDAESTRITLSATVIQSTPLTLSTKVNVPVFCNGDSSGAVLSTSTGGKSPYMYSIDGITFQSSRYFLNLKAGTYNITTKDANGCIAVSSITLSEPSALTATYEIVNDQNIFISASGGSNLYTYYLNNTTTGVEYGPETVGAFTKLPPGIYTIMLGDSNGCTFNQSGIKIEASQSNALSAVSVVDPADCVRLGRISVSAMGGKAPYEYSINNGTNYSSSNLFPSLSPGTYAVKVRDADLNTTSHSVTINPILSSPTIATVVKNISCQGLKNGSITVKGIGGSGNYLYRLNGGIQQNFDTFSNLAPGNYVIEIQDMGLCTATLTVAITEPEVLSATAKIGINQDITANVTGGSAPYSYALENDNGVIVAAPQSSNIFSNLATGLYTLKVIDANACSVSLPNIDVKPLTELSASLNATNITCSNPTGTIAIQATGGIPPYQYSLDNGTYVSSNLFENLAPKNYNVKVKDAQNTVFNLNTTIVQTTLLTVSAVIETPIFCPGNNTGFISATAKGGEGPYQFSIDGTNFQYSRYFDKLSAGSYNITTKDANGCLAKSSTIILSDPAPLSATYEIVNEENIVLTTTGGNKLYTYYLEDAATGVKSGPDHTGRFTKLAVGIYNVTIYSSECNISIQGIKIEPSTSTNLTLASFADPITCSFAGRITLLAKGGKAPYQYSLNNGDTYSSSNTFVGLTANYTYPVKVRDADLNTVTAMVPMNYIGDSVTIIDVVATDVSCAGNNDGKFKILTTNGIGQYNYSVNGGISTNSDTFDGLSPGSYVLSVNGVNICNRFIEVIIKEPAALVANATVGNDQSVTVNVTGGSAPYSYSLENENGVTVAAPQSSNTFKNLATGVYTLKVIDANTCSVSLSNITIIEVPELTATATITNVTCNTAGTVTINANGGSGTYQYSIDGGISYSSSNIFTGLTAGSYTFKIKDSQNAVFTLSLDITITTPLQLIATVTSQQTCSGPGTITAVVAGGLPPYYYSINNGAYSTSNIFSANSGMHMISVKDSNNCIETVMIAITDPTPITADVTVENQTITVVTTGGAGGYQYAISPDLDKFSSNNIFTDLLPGTYTVLIQDATGCYITLSVVVDPPAPLIEGKDTIIVEFTSGQTLGDIVVEGENIQWYSSNTPTNKKAETALPLTTVLIDGVTYYASQTVNGIESKERLAVTAKLKGGLSTPDFELANFQFYPNPVKEILTIDNTSVIDGIEIFSLSGKSVLVKKINDTRSQIDLSHLSNGVYFLKVKSQGKERTIKIIK